MSEPWRILAALAYLVIAGGIIVGLLYLHGRWTGYNHAHRENGEHDATEHDNRN